MEDMLQYLRDPGAEILRVLPRIAGAVALLLASVIIGRISGRALLSVLQRGDLSRTHRLFFRNLTVWTCVVIGSGMALGVLGLESVLVSLVAGSGIVAIVFGFAFKEIGENLLAGLFLAFSRPFNIGDYILSESLQGEVREIELRFTHVRTADGRDIYIPNAQVFNRPLINFTRDGFRRPSFTVGVDYADDARKVRAALLGAVAALPGVLRDPEPMVTVSNLAAQYVEFEIAFWVDTFGMTPDRSSTRIEQEDDLWRIRSEAMQACRAALMREGFTVSANVTTNASIAVPERLEVKVAA